MLSVSRDNRKTFKPHIKYRGYYKDHPKSYHKNSNKINFLVSCSSKYTQNLRSECFYQS